MNNMVEQLDEIRRQEANGEITSDESIITCDIIMNTRQEVERICNFCVTPGDTWCVCQWHKWYKYNY